MEYTVGNTDTPQYPPLLAIHTNKPIDSLLQGIFKTHEMEIEELPSSILYIGCVTLIHSLITELVKI